MFPFASSFTRINLSRCLPVTRDSSCWLIHPLVHTHTLIHFLSLSLTVKICVGSTGVFGAGNLLHVMSVVVLGFRFMHPMRCEAKKYRYKRVTHDENSRSIPLSMCICILSTTRMPSPRWFVGCVRCFSLGIIYVHVWDKGARQPTRSVPRKGPSPGDGRAFLLESAFLGGVWMKWVYIYKYMVSLC